MVLDVDSTLIQQEVVELIAARADVKPEVRALTNQAMAGEIDFATSLKARVALLKGIPSLVFEEILSEIEITDGVKELIAAVHAANGKIGAVSGGFSQILEPLAVGLEIDFWQANELSVEDGALTGRLLGDIVDAEAKASALRSWAKTGGFEIKQTVAVGDGANDVLMLQAAGLAVAFRPKPILRGFADLVIEENSLRPLISELGLSAS